MSRRDDRPLTHPILVGGEFLWRPTLASMLVSLVVCLLGVGYLGSDGIILVLVGVLGACLSVLIAAGPLCWRKTLVVTAGGMILKTLFTERFFPDDAVRAVRRDVSPRAGGGRTFFRTDLVFRIGGREVVIICEYHGNADNTDPLTPLMDRYASALADGHDIRGDGWYQSRGILTVAGRAVPVCEISAVIVRGGAAFYYRGDDVSAFLRVDRDETNAEPLKKAVFAARGGDPTFNAPLSPPSPGRVLLQCRNAWPGGGRRHMAYTFIGQLVLIVGCLPMSIIHPSMVFVWAILLLGLSVYLNSDRRLVLTENLLRYVGPVGPLTLARADITTLTSDGYALLRVETSARVGATTLCVGSAFPRNGSTLVRIAAALAEDIARRWLAELLVREVPWTADITFTADGLRVGTSVVPYACLVVTLDRRTATLSRVEKADAHVRTIIATLPLSSPNCLPGLELLCILVPPVVPTSDEGTESKPVDVTTFASARGRSLLPSRDE